MPADQVSAKPIAETHGLLQVDPPPRFQRAQRGATQGLVGNVGAEAVGFQFHHGQAAAIDGDAVADARVAQIERSRGDPQAAVAALIVSFEQGSHGRDDSGKHADVLNPPQTGRLS